MAASGRAPDALTHRRRHGFVAGVDGCRGGWMLAARQPGSRAVTLRFVPLGHLGASLRGCLVAGIDIPIGLPGHGVRDCDVQVRRALGPERRSSVFPAPVRPVLQARTYRTALAVSRRVDGRGLSAQGFHLIPRIREVDILLQHRPQLRPIVHEVHPELSFAFLNGGTALADAKHTPAGLDARWRLLEQAFGGALGEAIRRTPLPGAEDDVLDAMAVLWSAERIRAGRAIAFPAGAAPVDARGVRMQVRA